MAHRVNWSVLTQHMCAQLKKMTFFFYKPITFVIILSPLFVLLMATQIVIATRRSKRRQVSLRGPMEIARPMTLTLILATGKYS